MNLKYIVEICVAIDISILGIAYPIMINIISNIGDKYKSEYISILFENEFPQFSIGIKINKKLYELSIFKLTLYLTILTFLPLIFNFQPSKGCNYWFINNSAKILVLISTSILVIFFFIWLDKVFLFTGKSTILLKRIISNYNNLTIDEEIKSYHLKSINELSIYAIQKQDEHLQQTLVEFYYREFSIIRKKHDKSTPLIYPIDLYFIINKINFELENNQNMKLLAIEHRAVSGIWLLGEDFEDITISSETYNWMWRNLYLICEKEKLVRMYWANVSQYFESHLQKIYKHQDFEKEEIHSIQIKKRNEERLNFLEFNYALGGLLFYRNQYKSIKYILEYSQSQPPRYPLLPENMTDIFFWFENFRNEFTTRSLPIDSKYSFPELDNLGNSRQVILWICKYLTLLFIRQYSLPTYYVFQRHTSQPKLPDDIIELNNWLDSVRYFEYCLTQTLENKELITVLNWENLTKQNEQIFITYITDLKNNIKNKILQQKYSNSLSSERIAQFEETSNKILSDSFNEYNDIFISNVEEQNEYDLKFSISGGKTLMPKSAFTDGDIPHLNYDTVFATQIVNSAIETNIPNSFVVSSTRRYLLNDKNIIDAIAIIIKISQEIVIIGINISYELKELLKTSHFYPSIKYIPAANITDVLFILKKSDLPRIEHKILNNKEINEDQLKEINKKYKIYTSVIDINTENNIWIKNQWGIQNDDNNLDLKVQITIAFLSIIYWKKDRDIIQINLDSKFKEQGIQSDINEIKPLF